MQAQLWHPKYEGQGLLIEPVKKKGERATFTPADFRRARALFTAEEIDIENPDSVFRGMVYALLTRSSSYDRQDQILTRFHSDGLDSAKAIAARGDLMDYTRGVTYPQRLADDITAFAREWWPNLSGAFISCLRTDLEKQKRDYMRDQLTRDCPGLGNKCASLLLRMAGYLDAVPLDRWALRFLRDTAGHKIHQQYDKKKVKYDGNNYTRGLRTPDYMKYENAFSDFANDLEIAPAALQMLVYVHRTGWDHERHPFMETAT